MKALQVAKRSVAMLPVTAATTARTAVIDTDSANAVAVTLVVGALANTTTGVGPTLQFRHSDDATTGFATFDATLNRSITGRTGLVSLTLLSDMARIKKYVELTVTPGTTVATDAVIVAATVELDPDIRVSDLEDLATEVAAG
jgi:hypothetical protein